MAKLEQGEALLILLEYVTNNIPLPILEANCIFQNQASNKESNVPFLDTKVVWFTGKPVGAGWNSLHRTSGSLVMEINVPKETGIVVYAEILDKLIKLFRRNTTFRQLGFVVEGIHVDPDESTGTSVKNSEYYKETLNILFYIEGL